MKGSIPRHEIMKNSSNDSKFHKLKTVSMPDHWCADNVQTKIIKENRGTTIKKGKEKL